MQKLDRVLGEALKVARLMREPAVVVGLLRTTAKREKRSSAPTRKLDRLLPCVLGYTGGKHARAALLLGITRRTLRTKPRELGLHVTHPVEANEGGLPKPHRVPPPRRLPITA